MQVRDQLKMHKNKLSKHQLGVTRSCWRHYSEWLGAYHINSEPRETRINSEELRTDATEGEELNGEYINFKPKVTLWSFFESLSFPLVVKGSRTAGSWRYLLLDSWKKKMCRPLRRWWELNEHHMKNTDDFQAFPLSRNGHLSDHFPTRILFIWGIPARSDAKSII